MSDDPKNGNADDGTDAADESGFLDLSEYADEHTNDALRKAAFRLFEEGDFDACMNMLQVLNSFGALSLEMALLQTVCMSELGKGDEALALFEKIEANVKEALTKTDLPEDERKTLLKTFETTRSWLPGGRNASETRNKLQHEAEMMLPRLPRGKGK
jgi:hypothetical protein